MKTLMSTYEQFTQMVVNAHIYRNRFITFCDICRNLKVSPADLDEVIYKETGFYGEEILKHYRMQEKI